MAGIFDRLQKELEDREQEGGITALDLADLPSPLRKLMRLMLREIEMDYESLSEAAKAMPKSDFMDKIELDQALDTLCDKNWLIRRGQGEVISYRVNLRRKAGSNLSQNIWSALNKKIEHKEDQ
jgi:hypothetical protein